MTAQKIIRHSVSRVSGLVLVAALLLLPISSGAEDKTWVGGSGWWDVGTNWDPPGQPREDDEVYLSNSGANDLTVYYRNLYYSGDELHSLRIQADGTGSMNLVMDSDYSLRLWYAQIFSGGPAIISQSSGSFIGQTLDIGYRPGTTGTYELTGGSLQMIMETIGRGGGTGILIQRGGTNTMSGGLYVGGESDGTYELHGGELEVGGNLFLGGDNAQGTFTQTGGSNRVTGLLFVGSHTVTDNTYTLEDGDLEAGEIGISGYGDCIFTQTGGGNTVGDLNVGGLAGGGTYALSGGDLLVENLNVGAPYSNYTGQGFFNQTGGTNTVLQTLSVGKSAGDDGTYLLSRGILSASSIHVGDLGFGMFQQTGGTIFCDEGSLSVGHGEGGSGGSFDLQGGNLWTRSTFVGFQSPGTFSQSGGRHSASYELLVGFDAPGSYILSGDGSLEVGRESIGWGNVGTFTQTGGTNQITRYLWLGVYGSQGDYSLEDGTLSAPEVYVGLVGGGNFSQAGGEVNLSQNLFLSYGVHPDSDPGHYLPPGQGTYTLSGGRLAAHNEYVGYAGSGSFTQTGGNNSITNFLYLGFAADSSGSYSLGGDGVLQARNEVIGHLGSGRFSQENGRNFTANLVLGGEPSGVGAYVLSGGDIRAVQETIGLNGSGVFTQTGGNHRVRDGLALAVNRGSSGEYVLRDGTLRTGSLEVGRSGTFTQSGGRFSTGPLSNAGTVNLEGGKVRVRGDITNQSSGQFNISMDVTFPRNTTNDGTIKTTGAEVTWGGTFTNNGAYISDPATQSFKNLMVGPSGYLKGGEGDTFIIRENFINSSTQSMAWNTSTALLKFVGEGDHVFQLAGHDLGPQPSGYLDNFAWGILELSWEEEMQPNRLILEGDQGFALYVGEILGLTFDDHTVTNLIGNDLNLYYDPTLTGNKYLGGETFALLDGGQLAPAVPLPPSVLLLGTGLLGLGVLGYRRGKS